MSPKSRGRPPGRGRSGKRQLRSASVRGPDGSLPAWRTEEKTDCWFDEPFPGDRKSWAAPAGHGTYQGLDVELLAADDEHERGFLLQAQHSEMAGALERDENITTAGGEVMSPALHVTLHEVVANQLLADDPPETWQTVQRLAAIGYDWHNVMHMIMELVSQDLFRAGTEKRDFDRADYVRRLHALPGDWPSPEKLDPR